jgi:hypothetical protein
MHNLLPLHILPGRALDWALVVPRGRIFRLDELGEDLLAAFDVLFLGLLVDGFVEGDGLLGDLLSHLLLDELLLDALLFGEEGFLGWWGLWCWGRLGEFL